MNNALNTWIDLVSCQDMEAVVSLYADSGLLLGTFSDEIRIGKDQIREYFEYFLEKKRKASVIDSVTHNIGDNVFVVSGFYDFIVEDKNQINKTVNARFTFVFKSKDDGFEILSHHSSVVP